MDYNDIPSELTEKLPVEAALDRLCFSESSDYGNPKRTWGPIEVIAGPWVGCWKLIIMIKRNSADIINITQESSIGLFMRPIDILAIIYCACDSLFQKEEPPQELMWGKLEWDRYNELQRQELERRPKVWAEKNFFRFCITYLEKNNDWASEDYDVDFSHADGQLRLKAKNDVVFCPAIGTFNGTLTMSARQLFRRLPKRFLRSTVFIQVLKIEEELMATIGDHAIPARWVENPILQDYLASYLENNPDVLLTYDFVRRDEKTTSSARSVLYEKIFDQYESRLRLTIQIKFELDIYDNNSASYTENRLYTLNGVYLVVTDRQMEREGDKYNGYYYEDPERPREIDRCKLEISTFEDLLTLCNMIGDKFPKAGTKILQQESGISASVQETISTKPYGSENTIFTEEKANVARVILRKYLSGIHKEVSINSEPEAADLSTKSTYELVGDVFKIIDEHINLEKKNISNDGGVARDNMMKDWIPGQVPIPENSQRLNIESKKALLALNQKPDETGLYCLQLAKWCLEHRLEDRDGRLIEMVMDIMPGWNPAKTMKLLTTDLNNGEKVEPVPWEKVRNNPEELADQIVLAISDQLMLHYLDAYPKTLQPKI